MDNPPPIPSSLPKPGESFGHQAAKFSLYAPLVALALGCVLNSAFNKQDEPGHNTTMIFLGAFNLLLIVAGAVFGVVALASMRKYGRKGILARAIVGLVLNGGMLGLMAFVFLFNPTAGATSRIVGDWTSTPQPNGQQMDLHFGKDMSAQCTVHGEHPKNFAGHWTVLRDKDATAPFWLVFKIEAKDSPDGKPLAIKWKISRIEPDTLSLEGETPEIYTRIKP